MTDRRRDLIERDRSALVLIDVQEYFIAKLPLCDRKPLVERLVWTLRMARALRIPVVATAEDVKRNGPLLPDLTAELPAGTTVHDKLIFGLMADPAIRRDIEATGRDTFVLIGLETDVCICHSAFGIEAAGYRAVVVDDATASPPPHHSHGLRRLADAGITVTSLKGVYYEWVRDLATHARVKAEMNTPPPSSLIL